jgi:hypothetical protein
MEFITITGDGRESFYDALFASSGFAAFAKSKSKFSSSVMGRKKKLFENSRLICIYMLSPSTPSAGLQNLSMKKIIQLLSRTEFNAAEVDVSSARCALHSPRLAHYISQMDRGEGIRRDIEKQIIIIRKLRKR